MKIAVLGGGYAGLACLIELSRMLPEAELHLIDAHTDHCKITNLHKTFRKPVAAYCVPYTEVAERFRFRFHRARLEVTPEALRQWQARKTLDLPGRSLSFDCLVVCTGAAIIPQPGGRWVFGQQDLRKGRGEAVIDDFLARYAGEPGQVTVVGGGATGIQVLFELRDLFRDKRAGHGLRLVDLHHRLTPDLPQPFHRYIAARMAASEIDYRPGIRYLGQSGDMVKLEAVDSGRRYTEPSGLTLLFPGVKPEPGPLAADGCGRVILEGETLRGIFTAGDCSRFRSAGLNRMTAQAAIRKGKLVAQNIRRLFDGAPLREYRYREKGYFVALGRRDAVGWVGLRFNVVRGLPALGLKEALETQYDLYLRGLDTYPNFLSNF